MIPALLLALQQSSTPAAEVLAYDAWLETPGGQLRFGLELAPRGEGWSAFLINGEERIAVPRVSFSGKELLLDMPHYDSRIRAKVVPAEPSLPQSSPALFSMDRLEGQWEKRRSEAETAHVSFAAQRLRMIPFLRHDGKEITGRWHVAFEGDAQPSVALFRQAEAQGLVTGTFLTSTGDYRYLAGWWTEELTLSCFDGAHAFLFKAKLRPDGTLAGDFWSGNWHHETWTAKRDDDAELADSFAQTKWNGTTKLADLTFPDLDGKPRSLGELGGKATLLVVFGSWCPNCNDEALFLKELDAKYRERGLRILGLAFELTGEFARDAGQVKIFAERHGLAFPFFLCGTADKAEATKALRLVDKVRAFPTTLFVGPDGRVRSIHSGYAGPATGEEHKKLRAEFERRIEELLAGSR